MYEQMFNSLLTLSVSVLFTVGYVYYNLPKLKKYYDYEYFDLPGLQVAFAFDEFGKVIFDI